MFEEIANPTPVLPGWEPSVSAASEAIWELTPITSPDSSISGPPELPGFRAASVWIAPVIFAPSGAEISRSSAETMPFVNVSSRPVRGADRIHRVADLDRAQLASVSGVSPRPDGSTSISARSWLASSPTIFALVVLFDDPLASTVRLARP